MYFSGYIHQQKSFNWFDTRSVDSTKPLRIRLLEVFLFLQWFHILTYMIVFHLYM